MRRGVSRRTKAPPCAPGGGGGVSAHHTLVVPLQDDPLRAALPVPGGHETALLCLLRASRCHGHGGSISFRSRRGSSTQAERVAGRQPLSLRLAGAPWPGRSELGSVRLREGGAPGSWETPHAHPHVSSRAVSVAAAAPDSRTGRAGRNLRSPGADPPPSLPRLPGRL